MSVAESMHGSGNRVVEFVQGSRLAHSPFVEKSWNSRQLRHGFPTQRAQKMALVDS
jgi:hypothetical protein